jgi:NADPH-dependent curcumin reductase CurA
MLVGDHEALRPRFVKDVAGWIRDGELKYQETYLDGIENNLDAFLGVLRGDNTGKMLVRLPG